MTNDIPQAIAERYSRQTAVRHERLYGRGYQGPAEEGVFNALVGRLDFAAGCRVLDVGSGLGGDAFRLVDALDVEVVGLDASQDMVSVAQERQTTDTKRPWRVTFEHGNVLHSPVVASGSFDVVWTRDAGAFLTVAEKQLAWARLFDALRSRGQVLITDYCVGPRVDGDFTERMRRWGQHMITMDEYANILRTAGFVDVTTEDQTADLLASQLHGRALLREERDSLLEEFGADVYESMVQRWEEKIHNCSSGSLTWMVLTASKL